MSNTGRNKVGRPDAMIEGNKVASAFVADSSAYFFVYCGGSGGGGCINTMGVTGVVFPVQVRKNIVYNERIVFQNREFYGVRIYADGGPSGLCDHSLGAEVPWYMALSVDGNMTDAEVMEQGVQLSGPMPYEIEFKANRIPQPDNPLWTSRIYVHLVWGSAGFISSTGITPNENSLRVVKHDYEAVD